MLQNVRRCLINFVQSTPLNAASGQIFCSRSLHLSGYQFSPVTATEGNVVSKEALMELRKRTGYSISKCKQAIMQFGDDLAQAEEWLQQTARKEGWDKISKRANVNATQGLLGLITSSGMAAIVEVNCQTDFVARNDTFRSGVSTISRGVLNDAIKNYRLENNDISTKWNLSYERISDKGLEFGSSLPDLLADTVGRVGEKISVGGAFVMRVAPDISLTGYVHPRSDQNVVDGVATGHFAALVAFRAGKGVSEDLRSKIGTQLCQHIIGMNPSGIGLPPDMEAAAKKQEAEAAPAIEKKPEDSQKEPSEQDEDDRESEMHAKEVTQLSNETTLLRQDFLLEPDATVYEYLRQFDATVVDFVRFERGGIGALHSKNANA